MYIYVCIYIYVPFLILSRYIPFHLFMNSVELLKGHESRVSMSHEQSILKCRVLLLVIFPAKELCICK